MVYCHCTVDRVCHYILRFVLVFTIMRPVSASAVINHFLMSAHNLLCINVCYKSSSFIDCHNLFPVPVSAKLYPVSVSARIHPCQLGLRQFFPCPFLLKIHPAPVPAITDTVSVASVSTLLRKGYKLMWLRGG
jgi:hypothetical protein